MPFTGPLEDRLAIRELYGCYAGAACTGDGDAWLACWSADPEWITPAVQGKGRDGIRAQWDRLWQDIERMAFLGEVVSIEAEGDRAVGRAYCREVSDWKDGRKIRIIGRYDDQIVRENGEWRFQRRNFTMQLVE
jgi:ketosteroid isomerase-like protein